MLEQVAAHQPLLHRRAIEEGFPLPHLRLLQCRHRHIAFVRRAGREPACQRAQLGRAQAGQAVGHAGQRLLLRVVVELLDGRTALRAVERKIEAFVQHGAGRQRVLLFQRQAAVEQAALQVDLRRGAALVEHGIEALLAPLRGQLRIDEQARRRRFAQARAVVHRIAAAAARHALPGAELDLARCVVAAMTDDTAALQDRLHLGVVRDGGAGRRERHVEALGVGLAILVVERVPRQRGAADQAAHRQAHGQRACNPMSIRQVEDLRCQECVCGLPCDAGEATDAIFAERRTRLAARFPASRVEGPP